jgi:hypothetical protein
LLRSFTAHEDEVAGIRRAPPRVSKILKAGAYSSNLGLAMRAALEVECGMVKVLTRRGRRSII